MRTTGEIEFQKFCDTHGITCSALPAGPGKTPDFELVRKGMTVVAEVKDFKDTQAYKPPQPNSVRIVSHEIGGRVSDAIRDANQQLKGRPEPGIVVLYNDSLEKSHVTEFDIRRGLFGEIIAHLDSQGRWVDTSSGGKRTLTPQENTTISAVCVLRQRDLINSKDPLLTVYHNPFARQPLDPAFFAELADVVQLRAKLDASRAFREWERI